MKNQLLQKKLVEADSTVIDFKSWFDLWHIHFTIANKILTWEDKKKHFEEVFAKFEYFKNELLKYKANNEFQIFFVIFPNNISDNALYIHTKNPNKNNFPVSYQKIDTKNSDDSIIIEFIRDAGFDLFTSSFKSYSYIICYDKQVGIPPKKNI